MKTTALFCCILFSIVTAYTQPICGFDKMHEKLLASDPTYATNVKTTNENIRRFIAAHPNGNAGSQRVTATYTIPVVVHIVHTGGVLGSIYNPTDAQVTGAINYLNKVYNGTHSSLSGGVGDMGIQFALAQRDPNCNPTTGINHVDGSSISGYAANGVNFVTTNGVPELNVKNFIRWDPNNYYNIWIVNKIDGLDGTTGQFYAGFAYFPGSSSSLDGTVMLATQMVDGQKTLPHEIGHAFNLYHPFQGSSIKTQCPANTDCTTDGDQVCDTDPITYNADASNVIDFSCRTGTNTCTGTAYSINTESNFMNYTNCYTLFTAGQKTRAQAALALTSRSSLVASLGATPPYLGTTTCAPKINFELSSGAATETTTTTTGCRSYTDYTYYMTIGNNPSAAATATIAVQAGGTATEGVDFDITTNGSFTSASKTANFPAGAHNNIPFTVRIYDDASVESTEYFILNYTVNAGAGNAVAGSGNTTLTISIVDNDVVPLVPGTPALATNANSPYYYITAAPFDATQQHQKSQYIYKASELTAAGVTAGNITAIQLYVSSKLSTRAFSNFSIKLVNTTNTSLYINGVGATLLTGLTTVYSAASFATTGSSWNSFTFSTPFTWDGVSNVGMEICFENGTADANAGVDQLFYYSDAASAGKGTLVYENDINCGGTFNSFVYYNAYKPIIKLTYGLTGNAVETAIASSNSQYLGPNADVYFYDAAGKIMARVQNLGSFDYGCTQVSIDRTGSGAAQFWNSNTGSYLTSKSFKIIPTNNTATGNFQVTLYYNSAEVSGWQTATGQTFSNAKLVKVSNGYYIPDVTPATQHLADISYTNGSTNSYGTGSTITGTFSSSSLTSGLAVGIATPTTTWTGASSNAWALAANWNNGVPDGSYNAIVPNTSTSPSITANQNVRDLTVNAGATIAIGSGFNLQVGGNLTHNGTVTGSGATVLNGGSQQTVSGTGTIANFTLNNSTGATITAGAGNMQSITGTVTLSAGTLNTNGNLTLKSSVTNTARIAAITAGAVSGNITTERYLPAKRAFRFLTSPVTTSTTINANWQEGNSSAAGYGTHITGTGGASNGFDATTSNNASLFTFNAGTQAWIAVGNTNTNLLTAGAAYRILVRGDRTISLASNTPTPSNTVLRSTGTIVSGSTTINGLSSAANGYSFVGNPYPSPIDWESVSKTNLNTTYYVWDPTLAGSNGRGAYVAYNGTSHTNNNASSVVDKNIQMGQAFFVQTTANGAASLGLVETNKTATNTAVFRTISNIPTIAVQLFVGSPLLNTVSADGATILFDDAFSKGQGQEDALKLNNLDENIAFSSKNNLYSIEGIPKVGVTDTLQIELSQLTGTNYSLRFNTDNINNAGTNIAAYLLDKQTGNKQALSNTGQLDIAFTSTTALTDKNRFVIVFENSKTIMLTNQLQLYPNPASEKVQVLYSNQEALNTTITITNSAGALVKQIDLGKLKEVREWIDIRMLSSGLYFVQLNNGKDKKTEQLVIQ